MGTTTLYDKSGKAVDVPDEQVTQKLVSGELGTNKASVVVRSSAGKVYSVPTENLSKLASQQPGIKVMSDAEVDSHEQAKAEAAAQERYGGIGNMAHVALMSGNAGLTVGGSDYLAGKVLTDEQKRELEAEKAANPTTNLVAGLAGAVLPTLLTGGAAAPEEAAALGLRETAGLARAGEEGLQVAKAANTAREVSTAEKALNVAKSAVTAPTRALDAASSTVERGVRHLVGTDAESFFGQLAQKAVAKAAGGMTTGALATGAMDIGEDSLSTDHNLTGEQLLQHMGIGALLGGGLGALGGAGGQVLEKALARDAGEAGEAGGKVRQMLRDTANEWEVESTGAKTKEINKLTKNGMTEGDIGQWMHDNLSQFTEDGSHPITRDAKLQAAEKAIEDAQPKIAGHIDALDTAGFKPDWEPTIERLKREVVDPLAKSVDPRVQAVGNGVQKLIENAEAKLGENPSFRELYDLRREIDQSINFNKADLTQTTLNKEYRNIRSVLEDEIGKQGRASLGEEWGKGYDAAKTQYRMGSLISDAIQSVEKRAAGHEPVSLTSTILGAHGLGAFAAGHPMGLLAGAAGMVGNHLLKTYGKAVGSRLLNNLLATGTLEKVIQPELAARSVVMAQKAYEQSITRGMNAITRGAVVASNPGRPKSLDSDYAEKSKAVQAMLADPRAHAQEIATHAQALGPTFSTTASAYQRSALSSSVFFKSALPQEKPINPASPQAGTIKPSDAEKAKFIRQFNAVEDPSGLLHAASKGLLTRDMVDAVAQTKPAVLQDMQKRLSAELKTLKEPLEPSQAAAVKMILGEPIFDQPIAPLPQPKVATAGGTGGHSGGGHTKTMKGSLSSATALHGSALGS